jgi:hypothetical protein
VDDELAVRAAVLRKLPMVSWDRLVRIDGELHVYGWIEREGKPRDFVLLSFRWPQTPAAVEFTTSSAKFSAEIGRLLYGEGVEHVDCERVSEVFRI